MGGCAACHRPPGGVVELLTAAVFALLAWRLTAPVELLAFVWIGAIGVALAFVDVAVHRLPDRLTLPAYFGGAVLLALTLDFERLGVALLCSLAMTAGYLTLILISGSGMGLGDGKLALSLGLALGWFGGWVTFYGAMAGFLLSGLFATVMLLAGRLGRKDSIAHGPFMLMGTLIALALLG